MVAKREFLAAVLMAILLSMVAGCRSRQIVRVPVPVPCPQPPAVTRPTLPLQSTPATATAGRVIQDLVISIELLQGYAVQLEQTLEGYR